MTMLCSGLQLLTANFQGADATSGPVNISVPGVKRGDVLLSYSSPSLGTYPGSGYFYQTVQADDEIYQTAGGDQSSETFSVALMRFI